MTTYEEIHQALVEGIIDRNRILPMVEAGMFGLESPGICIYCGEEVDGVEPDAEHYPCDACSRDGVFGAEQIFLMIAP